MCCRKLALLQQIEGRGTELHHHGVGVVEVGATEPPLGIGIAHPQLGQQPAVGIVTGGKDIGARRQLDGHGQQFAAVDHKIDQRRGQPLTRTYQLLAYRVAQSNLVVTDKQRIRIDRRLELPGQRLRILAALGALHPLGDGRSGTHITGNDIGVGTAQTLAGELGVIGDPVLGQAVHIPLAEGGLIPDPLGVALPDLFGGRPGIALPGHPGLDTGLLGDHLPAPLLAGSQIGTGPLPVGRDGIEAVEPRRQHTAIDTAGRVLGRTVAEIGLEVLEGVVGQAARCGQAFFTLDPWQAYTGGKPVHVLLDGRDFFGHGCVTPCYVRIIVFTANMKKA